MNIQLLKEVIELVERLERLQEHNDDFNSKVSSLAILDVIKHKLEKEYGK